jgi:hypothetical protein
MHVIGDRIMHIPAAQMHADAHGNALQGRRSIIIIIIIIYDRPQSLSQHEAQPGTVHDDSKLPHKLLLLDAVKLYCRTTNQALRCHYI